MATLEQPPVQTEPHLPAVTNPRWLGYARLLQMRMLELWREPEVIFWVFIFPLLLALGLGIAFREKPPDVTPIAVIEGPKANDLLQLLQGSPEHAGIRPDVLSEQAALDGFRLGQYSLVVSMDDSGLHYRYDPARPESVLARTQVNDALEDAAGRKNPIATTSTAASEPGARYIDFLIPGLLGMNLMNSGMWGIGFALVEMRQRKAAEALRGHAHAALGFLARAGFEPPGADADRSRAAARLRRPGVSRACRRQRTRNSAHRRAGRGFVWRRRPADGQPRAKDRKR